MLKDPIIPESIPERLHGELTPPSTPHFRPEEVTPEPKTIYDQEPCPPGDVPPSDAAPNASAHERRSNIIQRPNIHITSAHAADDEGAGAKGIAALSLSEATAHGDGVASGTDGADADIAPWENRVREAADQDGEAFVTVGPMRAAELDATLERLSEVAMTVESDYTVVHTQAGAADPASGEATVTAFAVVRKLPTQNQHLDLRVAVVGNVDAGKSTLVGVLTGPLSFLDDGRGLARSRVLRHKHEAETGRTSSIAEDQHMRLTAKGQCLALERHQKRDAVDLSEAAKVVSFIDLAGHERYLRTTVYGLTAHEPDYVMVVVGANHGITRMTKEHVGMAIALNVPLFVVVTKVDLCPEPVMRETMKQLHRLLKLPGARKQPYVVKSNDELMVAANGFGKSALCPIFCISSVDGTNVPLLRQFFNLMPSRRAWAAQDKLPTEFLIDQYFNVPGVGLVVAGTLLSGAVHVNHELLMGPNNQGKFNKVTIKSIPRLGHAPHSSQISHPASPTFPPGDDQVHPPHAQPRPRAAPRPDRRVRRALAHQGARPPVRHPEGDGPPRRGGLPGGDKGLLVRRPRAPLSDDDARELPADPVRAQRAAVRPHLRDGQGGTAHRYDGTRLGRGASHAQRHSSPQLTSRSSLYRRARARHVRVHVPPRVSAAGDEGALHRGQDQGDRHHRRAARRVGRGEAGGAALDGARTRRPGDGRRSKQRAEERGGGCEQTMRSRGSPRAAVSAVWCVVCVLSPAPAPFHMQLET